MAISQYTMDRIYRGIRKIEKIELSNDFGPEDRRRPTEEVFVLVTGDKNGYYYPGVVTLRNAAYPDQTAAKYTDATYYDQTATILIEAINDEPLLSGSRYLGKLTSWYTDQTTGIGHPVYTVVYTPPVGYGSGYSSTAKTISSTTWTGVVSISSSVCTLPVIAATYYLIDDESIGMIMIRTPSSYTLDLGPFPLHGNIVIPSLTGTIAGTAGSCSISGTVTVPSQTVALSGQTACP